MDKTLKIILIITIIVTIIWSITFMIVKHNNKKELNNYELNIKEIRYV